MTRVQSWTLVLVAMVALIAGALLATGAVSWAQEGSPTPTESPAAATASPGATDDSSDDAATPTPQADDGSDDSGSGGEQRDGKNCPEQEDNATSETSDA